MKLHDTIILSICVHGIWFKVIENGKSHSSKRQNNENERFLAQWGNVNAVKTHLPAFVTEYVHTVFVGLVKTFCSNIQKCRVDY